ncbi:MAG: molybdate ABC transporter permease subunit [Leptospirales bacterium]
MLHSPFGITLELSFATATILILLGSPIAYAIAFSRRTGSILGESLVSLTLFFPPAVLGYLLMVCFSPDRFVGRLFDRLFGHPLAFSFDGLVVASIIYSLPFAVQPLTQSFRSVPSAQIEMAQILGASRSMTFFRILLPLSLPGFLTAWVLSFAHTVGEFGVVLMVGGNIPGETRTLSIEAYEDLLALDFVKARKAVIALLLLSLTSFLAIALLNRWRRSG